MPSIQKRGSSYRITVSCGYDANRKQIRKTKTYRPVPGMSSRQIEKEVNRFAIVFEATVKNGEYIDAGRIRLCDFCPQYLEIASKMLSPVTYSAYERIIQQYILPVLGHFRLSEIRPFHVQMFVQQLQAPGRAHGKQVDSLSASSVRRYFVVLQSILGRAYKLGMINSNPADSERIELPVSNDTQTDIFTKEEAEEMLRYLEREPMQNQLLIHLAILTGCRRGELLALTWDDIDYQTGIITVSKSNYQLPGGEVCTKTPKTKGSVRQVAVPEYCVEMLQSYRETQAGLLKGENKGHWIFTREDGSPMPPQRATRWFSDFLQKNHLRHRKFHSLRHTSATLLLLNGTNIKTVAARLGHMQISTTNRYVHAISEADRDAAELLGKLFSGDDTK